MALFGKIFKKIPLKCNFLFNFWDFPLFIALLPVMTVVMTVVIVMTMGWVSNYDCSHSHDYELELPVMTVVKVMTSSSSQFDCPAVKDLTISISEIFQCLK